MNYQEIDRDEFHALLCNTQQCGHILVNNHPYTCDQLYLTPYNPELMVLPLRYLD